MSEQPVSTWVIVVLDGSPHPAAVHAAWVLDSDEHTAEAFRSFVDREIDPAVKLHGHDPLAEVLNWRREVGLPAVTRDEVEEARNVSHYGEKDPATRPYADTGHPSDEPCTSSCPVSHDAAWREARAEAERAQREPIIGYKIGERMYCPADVTIVRQVDV